MKKSEKKIELGYELLCIMGIFTLAFVFAFQCANNLFQTGDISVDSGVFQYVARVIKNGGMPYKDTFDHKGPLLYLINVLGITIASWRGIWIIDLLAYFVSFVFMYKIARIKCTRVMAMLILLVTTSVLFQYEPMLNLTEDYALPFITLSIYIFADYFINKKITVFRLIVCGFSFGSVCMLRINMIAVWGVFCLCVLVEKMKEKRYKDIWKFMLFFLLGAFVAIGPLILWLWLNGAFKHFINDYFIFNFLYTGDVERASIANKVNSFVVFFNNTIFLIALMISIYKAYLSKKIFDCFYVAFMVFNVVSICISGQTYRHYGIVMVPTLLYPLSILGSIKSEREKSMKYVRAICVIYLLATFAVPCWTGAVNKMFSVYEQSKQNTNTFSNKMLQLKEIVIENSSKDDKIIVCGNWNFIYNLTERFAASRFSYQIPPCTISEDMAEEFLEDIENNKPKVVIMRDDFPMYNEMMIILENEKYTKSETQYEEYWVYIK